ncbi:titin-like isoform X2 [Astyanax mexicanus]|uniref:OTU deubiquitinase with linear linkage specificity n=1 Tax=Astyanax mexicanus TaxID=7994 RepID=A0A8B9KZE8_ASTMX|nr:titin-like isoform X2 [Astyanax mexicanus]
MGNSCCPPSNPCDHTVDETKGLLSSSESKNSTKAEGTGEVNFNSAEVAAEESKSDEVVNSQEVVTDQPTAVTKPEQAQSSYSATINFLHTEVSLAAIASQSSSSEAQKEPENATVEIEETKNDAGIEEIVTAESVNAPIETVPAEGMEEPKVHMTDVIVKVEVPADTKEASSEVSEEELQKLVAAVDVKNVAAPMAAKGEEQEEATAVAGEKMAAEVDVQKETTAVTGEKVEADVDVQKEAAPVAGEKVEADVDVQKEAAPVAGEKVEAEVDIQKEAATVAVEKVAAEVQVQREAAAVAVEKVAAEVQVAAQKVAAEVQVQREATAVAAQKEAEELDVQKVASAVAAQKETAEVEVQNVTAAADDQKEAAIEEVQKEEAVVEVQKEAAVVEVQKEAAVVEVQKKVSEVEVKKVAADEDEQKEPAEVNIEKKAAEEKPIPPVDDLIEKREHLAPSAGAQNNKKAETSVRENGDAEPQKSSPDSSREPVPAKVITEEPAEKPTNKVEDKHEEHIAAATAEGKGDGLPSETQEHCGVVTSLAAEISSDVTPHTVENGQGDNLKDESQPNVDAALVLEIPQETKPVQKTLEETSSIETKAQLSETTANVSSFVEQVEKSEPPHAAADQEKSAEGLLNGLDSSTPVEKTESTEAHGDAVHVESVEPTEREAITLDEHVQKAEEPEHLLSEKEKAEPTLQEPVEKEHTESHKGQKGEIILSSSHAVEVALIPVSEKFSEVEEELQEVEDLYRGAEEIEKDLPKEKQSKPLLEFTIPGVEERCSLAAAVDILAYSEREWKGNTAKSTLIRKGYSEMSCSFNGLRRVRGDNYCALRATLFQVLATTTQTPAWLQKEDFTSLPEKLEAQEHLIGGWRFPAECGRVGEKENSVEKLKHYMELLQKRWQAAVESVSLEERQHLCERVFQSGEEEYGLLEVLKFLMLATAVELHGQMMAGQEVPVFCWLLFARDTSETPKTLLNNHLSQVGFSGGLEQVEMFLLGYALQHTIQTFRLYKMDTEEFVTHYPDDHKQDWPCVCIVTEDDRHYNVPIRKQAQHQLNHDLSVPWPNLS